MNNAQRGIQRQREGQKVIDPPLFPLAQLSDHPPDEQQHQRREDTFDEKAERRRADHGAHKGICLIKAARSNQRHRTDPVGDIQRIEQAQLLRQGRAIMNRFRKTTSGIVLPYPAAI